jgi:hypothetical protein
VSEAGITRSSVLAPHKLSRDSLEGAGELGRGTAGWELLTRTRLGGLKLRLRYELQMEPATDFENDRPTRASRLSVPSLPGGVGSLSVGGNPGYRPRTLIVRVRERLWAALSRWDVDLSIVDNWFSDVDRR